MYTQLTLKMCTYVNSFNMVFYYIWEINRHIYIYRYIYIQNSYITYMYHTSLHGVATQKTAIFTVNAVRISSHTCIQYIYIYINSLGSGWIFCGLQFIYPFSADTHFYLRNRTSTVFGQLYFDIWRAVCNTIFVRFEICWNFIFRISDYAPQRTWKC
jgi:hypothetical protein